MPPASVTSERCRGRCRRPGPGPGHAGRADRCLRSRNARRPARLSWSERRHPPSAPRYASRPGPRERARTGRALRRGSGASARQRRGALLADGDAPRTRVGRGGLGGCPTGAHDPARRRGREAVDARNDGEESRYPAGGLPGRPGRVPGTRAAHREATEGRLRPPGRHDGSAFGISRLRNRGSWASPRPPARTARPDARPRKTSAGGSGRGRVGREPAGVRESRSPCGEQSRTRGSGCPTRP
jgi:hypothetical protein